VRDLRWVRCSALVQQITSGAQLRHRCKDRTVTYDDVIAIYLTEPATAIPVPEVPASSARRLRDALEPIATLGWWSPRPWDRLGALGLGFFEGYAWG
jgi:hypothetical protein